MFGRALIEVAVIVVGVMAALAADRWVTGIDERAEAADILARLAVDLESDSSNIAGGIEDARSRQLTAIRLLQDEEYALSEGPADFIARFETVSWGSGLEFSRESWDDLVTTGRMSLVSDPELRYALSDYYNSADLMSRLDALWTQRLATYYDGSKDLVPADVQLSALQDYPGFGALPDVFRSTPVTSSDVDRLRRLIEGDQNLRAELGHLVVIYQGKVGTYSLLLTHLSEVLRVVRGAL